MKRVIICFLFSVLHILWVKADWVNVTNEITNLNINALTATGVYIFAGNDQYVYRSSNNGDNWVQVYNLNALALASSGSYIYMGYQNGAGRSTNYGANWSFAGLNQWTLCLLANNNYVYAGCFWPIPGGSTNRGVWISSNNGANWSQTSLNDKNIYAFTISGVYLFAGGQGLYLSTNNGTNWSLSLLMSIWALASNGNFIYAGTDGTPYGVFLSTNYGANWVQTSLNNVGVYALVIYNNYVFAGSSSGFYVSGDSGTTWTPRNEGLTSGAHPLTIHNGYIFAGSLGQGVWRRPLDEVVGIKSISEEIPEGYELFQNYPNPFNPMTNIEFQLAKSGFVKLIIYDILGKEISKPVNGELKAGIYETEWGVYDFSSGTYFYSLIVDDRIIDTKKMIIAK